VTIQNYTRYNTEDLLALANRWEKTLVENGRRTPSGGFLPVAPNQIPAESGKITIRDYSPSSPFTERRFWNGSRSESVRERNYAYSEGGYRTDGGEVAIILPGKIYVDLVEALTSMGEDEPTIPFDMLKTVWRKLASMYGDPRSDENMKLNERTVPTDLNVRIEAKRESKRPKIEAVLAARLKLRAKLWSVVYYQTRSVREVERALRCIAVANRHAARGGMPVIDAERYEAILIELRELADTSRAYRNHVTSETPSS